MWFQNCNTKKKNIFPTTHTTNTKIVAKLKINIMQVNKFLLEHITKEDDKNHKFPNMKGDAQEIETQGVHPLEHHL